MNCFRPIICALLVLCTPLFSESKVLQYPTFELLSGSWREKDGTWRTFSKSDQSDLDRFTINYQKKAHLIFAPIPEMSRIPRVIHFIWLGPRSFPEQSVANVAAWKELHPDWVLKFWTDSKERPCPIEGMEKHLIEDINFLYLKQYLDKTQNWGEKADLIRYELIFQEGGMYVDHDVMPYRPFDAFHSAFDFFVGLENPHVNEGTDTKVFPCNCLFGARPNHPILKKTIKNVMERWEKMESRYSGSDPKSRFNKVMNRTFHSFTLATKECLNKDGMSDIVLPSSFFFAYKLFCENTVEQLKRHGLVYAKHDFAGAWVAKKDSSSSKSSKTTKKKKSKK